MSLTLTSTVPAAVQLLKTYLDTVAADNTQFEGGAVKTYIGVPIAQPANNYMMVGHWEDGMIFQNYVQEFAGMPVSANRKNESYEILGTIRVWSGSSSSETDAAQVARLTETMALVDGIMSQFANDPGGSGVLTASGTWEVGSFQQASSGPFGGQGWGILTTFIVRVFNVRLTQ